MIAVAGIATSLSGASAQLSAPIIDVTPGGATVDGAVGMGEYAGFSFGIHSGFGDVWGGHSELHLDSDVAGNVQLGFVQGPGSFSDIAVIYIDSVPGGFADTTTLTDDSDPQRAAISGTVGVNSSDLAFGTGFEADYAIAWDSLPGPALYELYAGGDHRYVRSLTSSTATDRETEFPLSDIGLLPGDSFDYVVTDLAGSTFRSDEFHGVDYASVLPGNPGFGPVSLQSDDFLRFVTVPEPDPVLADPLGVALLGFLRRRRDR